MQQIEVMIKETEQLAEASETNRDDESTEEARDSQAQL